MRQSHEYVRQLSREAIARQSLQEQPQRAAVAEEQRIEIERLNRIAEEERASMELIQRIRREEILELVSRLSQPQSAQLRLALMQRVLPRPVVPVVPVIVKTGPAEKVFEKEDCPVCMESMKDIKEPLSCGHWAHTECLRAWRPQRLTCSVCLTCLE